MSIAAAQYAKFMDQVAFERRAFSFTADDELLIYRSGNGDTVPFWSSRSRLETIRRRLPKYGAYSLTEFSLGEFYDALERLEAEGLLVGVNWSGEQLTGYNVPVADVRAALSYRLEALRKGELPAPSA
jgi:hypothetical protein